MVCLSRALAAFLGASVVAANNTDINTNNPFNDLAHSLANALHRAQAAADVTKSYTPSPLKTDHVLRDAPVMTDTQPSTQTSTDAAAATAELVRYVHHPNNCTKMCRGYCNKPDHAKDEIDLERAHKDCPECDCSKFKSDSGRSVSVTGALKTAGVVVVGVAGVMALL